MEQEAKVKSLAKAIHLLECFSAAQPELGITELAQMLGVNKSTVYNIASTFEQMGYLSQNPDNSKYYLGVKLLQFSYVINNHMGLQKFFLPFMKELARTLNMTVYLGIPHGGEVLYIECMFPDESSGWRHILGEHAPMHCTGIGKAMLAFLPQAQSEEYASGPLQRFTEQTITTKEALLDDLAATRERGYAIDHMEHELGIACIGMPLFSQDRRVVAAISASTSFLRLTPDDYVATAETMRAILRPAQYTL